MPLILRSQIWAGLVLNASRRVRRRRHLVHGLLEACAASFQRRLLGRRIAHRRRVPDQGIGQLRVRGVHRLHRHGAVIEDRCEGLGIGVGMRGARHDIFHDGAVDGADRTQFALALDDLAALHGEEFGDAAPVIAADALPRHVRALVEVGGEGEGDPVGGLGRLGLSRRCANGHRRCNENPLHVVLPLDGYLFALLTFRQDRGEARPFE